MKKAIALAMVGTLCLVGSHLAVADEKAPQKVIDLTPTLVKIGTDPIIVQATVAANAKGKTLEQIKEMDQRWQATPGLADFMSALMESECGQHLRQLLQSEPYYAEIFVMDNQGANVCMTDKTSDYWQGDEAKFTESFKGGAGAVHISDVKFDDSTQAYLVQVSVPVKNGDKVVGAITLGINVDRILN